MILLMYCLYGNIVYFFTQVNTFLCYQVTNAQCTKCHSSQFTRTPPQKKK